MTRLWLMVVVCAGCVEIVTAVVAAQPQPGEAPDASLGLRIVHRFDFEERKLGNYEQMPMHWYRVSGPGYPEYTTIGFDQQHARSPDHALKLALNGGSAAVVLQSGVLNVIPNARYRVTAQMRTERVVHARLRMVALFIDQHQQPLRQTIRRTEPTYSNEGWSAIQLTLPEAPPQAAWIILRLELLQPQQLHRSPPGPHVLVRQDIHATAWFDDVVVHQLPQIALSPSDPLNIYRQPMRPSFQVRVRDLTGQTLRAELRMIDLTGRVVARQRRPIDTRHPGQWTWTPDLDRLGWYAVELRVMTGEARVGQARTAVLWLPRLRVRDEDALDRFVINADDLPPPRRAVLPALLDRLGPQAVLLSVWHTTMDHQQLIDATDQPDMTIRQLMRDGRSVKLSFAELPQEMAMAVGTDPDKPFDMFARDPDVWGAYVDAVLARYGHHVDDWQIGRVSAPEAFWRDDAAAVYQRITDRMQRYVSEPRITLPWDARHALDGAPASLNSVMMFLPYSVRPGKLRDYAATWNARLADMVFHLEPLPAATFTEADRVTDLALRMVHAWRLEPRGLALRRPWDYDTDHEERLIPDPLMAVWANVAAQLAGRWYVGELNIGPGQVCHLLDGPGGGALVAWNNASPHDTPQLKLFLGDQPVAVDVWGNRTPLKQVGQKQQLMLTNTPQFIEGVDMRLARFRAAFRLDEPFIESIHARHRRSLKLLNPWPRTIIGRMRIVGPDGWDIHPRLVNFAIPAGETLDVPINFSFPIHEVAGHKRLAARFEFETDRIHTIDMGAPMEVGLPDIEVSSSFNIEPRADRDGDDVVVVLTVTNNGEQAQTFYAFAMAPGLPRQERIVGPIKGGQAVMKRFRFISGATPLSGKQIRVGVRQTDGPAVLNHRLDVP